MRTQLFLAFVTFLLASIPMWMETQTESVVLLVLHLIEALICSCSLFMYKDRPYSLFKIVHIFLLFFLCIAPIVQYKYNIQLWDGELFCENDYILTSFIVLLAIVVFNGTYYLIYKSGNSFGINRLWHLLSNPLFDRSPNKVSEMLVFMGVALLILCSVLYINNFNLLSLFLRGGNMEEVELVELATDVHVSQSAYLVIANFLRPMIVSIFLSAYMQKANRLYLIYLFLCLLLIAFPTAMARFSAAALYIPVLLVMSPLFRRKNVFVFSAILGLLVIFPFLDNFRHFSENTQIKFGINFDMFLEGHFDSYSSLLRAIKYNIITYGSQFLGVILFWVPRSVWPGKPIGSGAFMAEQLHLSFENISCCYFAEGYINAGFFGLLIFILFLAVFCSAFDNVYWESRKNNHSALFFDFIYFYLLGLLFFLLRGDLLSSFAFINGFICSIFCVYCIMSLNRKYKIVWYKN